MKGFVPITLLVTSPTLIAASNKAGFTSVKALVDAAKANPGKLSYASGGPGSAPHLATELFNSIAGIELLQEIGSLQQIIFYAHYSAGDQRGDPRMG